MARPLCRCCGKPIPKRTITYSVRVVNLASSVGRIADSDFYKHLHLSAPLRSKADCQRHSNYPVVSVSYWPNDAEGKRIASFSAWDGESYADKFFCKGSCATEFAYVMARSGRCTNVYNEAMAKENTNADG